MSDETATTIHSLPLAETARALRTGRRSPTEVVGDLRDRIDRVQQEVRPVVPEDGRRARLNREVTVLEREHAGPTPRPPLYGVPVGVKDIFHVDGLPTRAGSDLPSAALAGPEATCVTALRDAGALVLGKTVTTEFAYYEPGPTRNPHDPGHTPGGSSSGSAAAVAAGLCPLALGSQTIGSTIRPAAFCGVVGFKPSYGRIPIGGVIPLSRSYDHVGLFTQDVPGMRRSASVVCEEWDDGVDASGQPTLGVPEGPYLEQASREGLDRFEDHLDRLEAAGYEVRRVPVMDHIDEVNDRHNTLLAAEAAMDHHEWFEEYGERYAPKTADLLRRGRDVPVRDVMAGRVGRGTLRDRLTDAMDEHGIDLWASPAAPGPAPAGIDSTGDPAMNLPWTHAGMPAVSVPAGSASNGLPLGLQCVARFREDERLLDWAAPIADALAGAG